MDRTIAVRERTRSWRADALCSALRVDPELFFPIGHGDPAQRQEAEAKAICRSCPVVLACRQWADDFRPRVEGIWGASSASDRDLASRRLRRALAAQPGTTPTGQPESRVASPRAALLSGPRRVGDLPGLHLVDAAR
jgi:WhiB family redox-sensing transcriptional regulator